MSCYVRNMYAEGGHRVLCFLGLLAMVFPFRKPERKRRNHTIWLITGGVEYIRGEAAMGAPPPLVRVFFW